MFIFVDYAVAIFSGETELYEDDGNTTQYMNDKFVKTVYSFGHESAT